MEVAATLLLNQRLIPITVTITLPEHLRDLPCRVITAPTFLCEQSLVPPLSTTHNVYLINEMGTNRYKIGYSKNPYYRMCGGQTFQSASLQLVATCPGNRTVEKELQSKYESQRVRGEWFELSAEELTLLLLDMMHRRLTPCIDLTGDEEEPEEEIEILPVKPAAKDSKVPNGKASVAKDSKVKVSNAKGPNAKVPAEVSIVSKSTKSTSQADRPKTKPSADSSRPQTDSSKPPADRHTSERSSKRSSKSKRKLLPPIFLAEEIEEDELTSDQLFAVKIDAYYTATDFRTYREMCNEKRSRVKDYSEAAKVILASHVVYKYNREFLLEILGKVDVNQCIRDMILAMSEFDTPADKYSTICKNIQQVVTALRIESVHSKLLDLLDVA